MVFSSLEAALGEVIFENASTRTAADADTRYRSAMRSLQYLLPADRERLLSTYGLTPPGIQAASAGWTPAFRPRWTPR